MNKKLLIIFIALASFLLGINNVKAIEGENKIGNSMQYCMYCLRNNDQKCYIAMSSNNQLTESAFRLFYITSYHVDQNVINMQLSEKTEGIQYDTSSYWNFLGSVIWSNKYFFYRYLKGGAHNRCDSNFYTFAVSEDVIGIGEDANFYFIKTNETDEKVMINAVNNAVINTEVADGFLVSSEKLRALEIYDLKYEYGVDGLDFKANLSDKIYEIYNNYYWEHIGKIKDDKKPAGCAVLTDPIKNKINWALDLLKYGGAALAIILGMFDFFKATLSDEDNANKKAFERFVKRIIAAVLIFLLPLLIQFLFTTLNNPIIKIPGFNVDSPTCGIGESN